MQPSPSAEVVPPTTSIAGRGDSVLVRLAGPTGGVGFSGCDTGDYYNPANSMLCDVLSRRRGIPLTLALLQLAVAHRGGLGGSLDIMGLPARVVTRCGRGSGLQNLAVSFICGSI